MVGMFGSPFGNFTPVNGIVLPGSTAQAMGPGQQATGVVPTPGAPGPAPRLRSNMLRSPELTLATSGKLRSVLSCLFLFLFSMDFLSNVLWLVFLPALGSGKCPSNRFLGQTFPAAGC